MPPSSLFATCLALGAAALCLGPLKGAGPVKLLVPQWEMMTLFCVLWVTALLAPVSLHHRGNTESIELDAVPLSIGLVFLSPSLLIVGCAVGTAFVIAGIRRQAPSKVFFNAASDAFGAAVAIVTFRGVLGAQSAVSLRGWAAIAAGLIVRELISDVDVALVTRLAGRTAEHRTSAQFTAQTLFLMSNVCLAIVVLDALWVSLRATVPLFLIAASIIVAYRGYTRLTLRFASLRRLYDFSRALGTASLEPSSMSVEILRQVCTVMRARRAQLVLAEPSGIPRRICLDDHGPSGVEPIELDGSSFIVRSIDSKSAFVLSSPERASAESEL